MYGAGYISYVPVKSRIVAPYKDGLMALVQLCPSLATVLKSSTAVLYPLLDWWLNTGKVS